MLLNAAFAIEPDRNLTPGAIDPSVTQANIHETICHPKYTLKVRHVSYSTKKKVINSYLKAHPEWVKCKPIGMASCEIDHHISLEIGGSNDPKNLWPQPIDDARKKDVLENRLHRKVCNGEMTLQEAQKEILGWK